MGDSGSTDATVRRPQLDGKPEKNDIWQAASANSEEMVISSPRPSHSERELWYCPTVTIWDAHRAEKLFREHGISTVYDLGAGDFRFSLWLDREGYDVVAYELNGDLVSGVQERFDLGDVDVRERDYYRDYDDLVSEDAAVVAFGGTNGLPNPPDVGLGIEGYGEIGITVWYDGGVIAGW